MRLQRGEELIESFLKGRDGKALDICRGGAGVTIGAGNRGQQRQPVRHDRTAIKDSVSKSSSVSRSLWKRRYLTCTLNCTHTIPRKKRVPSKTGREKYGTAAIAAGKIK